MKLPDFRLPFAAHARATPRHVRATPQALLATIDATLSRAFRDAGLVTHGGIPPGIRATLDDAFAAAGLRGVSRAGGGPATYEGSAIVAANDDDAAVVAPDVGAPRETERGRFTSGSFTNDAGTRGYKLYVPARLPDAPDERMLVVMLHGCTQTPDDFAAGTRMNALAEREGLVVLYPAQDPAANASRCWNWFRPDDQERSRGEPAIIAGMARDVAQAQGIGSDRVFVAGLSAGAAMAVTLGATYPDVFAGVGAHSGLAHRAARDVASAFAAMHGGGVGANARPTGARGAPVPTIVFHGTADHTVKPGNGAAIVDWLVTGVDDPLQPVRHAGRTPGGRAYQRIVYADRTGRPVVEHWVLEGIAHAWSGGSPDGSYTDASGPDASMEMVRFFREQPTGRH